MGLRSVPVTKADGCSCAGGCENGERGEGENEPNSMAQIPVPVARSRTRWGFVTGARFNLPSSIILKEWCWRSKSKISEFRKVVQ